MKHTFPLNEPIDVYVKGVMYKFEPVLGETKDLAHDRLIIVAMNKKAKRVEFIWQCHAEVSYETQRQIEHKLINDVSKFTKDYGMIRVIDSDDRSLSLAGPDRKVHSMVKMNGRYYMVNAN